MIDPDLLADVKRVRRKLLDELLEMQEPGGYWVGELSTSALSTATTCVAFEMLTRAGVTQAAGRDLRPLINRGLDWLATNVNDDGGWGDTIKSKSNISTTTLCRAAFTACGHDRIGEWAAVLGRADRWINNATKVHESLSAAIVARYGKDKTFSVPILMQCALAGIVDWREIPRLPFELAVLPHKFYAAVKLPVVSYALPALIAIGQLLHVKNPTWVLPLRWLRTASINRTLDKLISLQPHNGGFLEAAPLTGFVTMSLAAAGRADHVVARRGAEFLVNSVRDDGSWPIDTNLSTWVTTLIVNALGDSARDELPNPDATLRWLLDQQHTEVHPFTNAAPGGWAWTPLPGGVPDADDTAGAIRALMHLRPRFAATATSASCKDRGSRNEDRGNDDASGLSRDVEELSASPDALLSVAAKQRECDEAALAGLGWLASLQNRDGGIPTFCRGWGTLPFDRSSCDITAHMLLALAAVTRTHGVSDYSFEAESLCASNYLSRMVRSEGGWYPLWFGNQHHSLEENPVYGTARVLIGVAQIQQQEWDARCKASLEWLSSAVAEEGGVGGDCLLPPTVEETAVTSEALIRCEAVHPETLRYLVAAIDRNEHHDAQPIGFYFAKLWYYEKLYPYAFALGALQAAVDAFDEKGRAGEPDGESTPR